MKVKMGRHLGPRVNGCEFAKIFNSTMVAISHRLDETDSSKGEISMLEAVTLLVAGHSQNHWPSSLQIGFLKRHSFPLNKVS